MKALVSIATAAFAVLTAGGIKAALPGAPTDPASSDRTATRIPVAAVVDGDTLRVKDLDGDDLGRVRLLRIDAPDVTHPRPPVACYATEATKQLGVGAGRLHRRPHHRHRPARPRPLRPGCCATGLPRPPRRGPRAPGHCRSTALRPRPATRPGGRLHRGRPGRPQRSYRPVEQLLTNC